jgi:hypothetical protein
MANAEYWRVHEEQYRAMARSGSPEGRYAWIALAERCAAMAAQEGALDEVAPRVAPVRLERVG